MQKHKEPQFMRKERLALVGAVRTKVVQDKTKYNRKPKHRGVQEDSSSVLYIYNVTILVKNYVG